MKQNPRLVCLAAGLAVLFSGCKGSKAPATGETTPPPASAAGAAAVVAVVNAEKITAKELDDSMKGQLRRLQRQQAEDRHSLLRSSLDALIARKLVQAEAKKRGTTEEGLLRAEVEAKAQPPSEAEMKAFYQENIRQMPGPFEMVRGRIGQHLMGQKQREALTQFLEGLRAAAKVETTLPPLELPRVEVAAEGPARGPAGAPVKVVLFSDFQCPYCKQAKGLVEQIVAVYGDKVQVVFRDYPLPIHDQAIKASEAAHCAGEQGKFWEMHDLLFNNQDKLAVDGLKSLARQLGLEGGKFDTCLDSGKMTEVVKGHFTAGDEAGVDATPAFFVNGFPVDGAVPFEEMKKVIDQELSGRGV